MSAPDTGVGVGHPAGARLGCGPPDGTRLRQLADEQAALRRVATLVASRARPAEVFSAVADELAQLIGAEASFVSCVELSSGHRPVPAGGTAGKHGEPEGTLVVEASYGCACDEVPVGFRAACAGRGTLGGVSASWAAKPGRAGGEP